MQSTGDNNPAGGGRISSSSQALGHFSLPRAPAADTATQRCCQERLHSPESQDKSPSQPLPLWPKSHTTVGTPQSSTKCRQRGDQNHPQDGPLLYLLQNFCWEHPSEPWLCDQLLSKLHPVLAGNPPDQVHTVPVVPGKAAELLHILQVTLLLLHLLWLWRGKKRLKKNRQKHILPCKTSLSAPAVAPSPFISAV